MTNKFSTLGYLLFATMLSIPAIADEIKLQENAPDRHVVQKGDTLWGIAGKFLKDPWRWPEIWQLNKEQIRNPHRIYPGNIIVLDKIGGQPRLRLMGDRETIRLSPQIRVSDIERSAIPSIPPTDIEPFLTRPLIIEQNALDNSAKIVAMEESRVAIVPGTIAYATGIEQKQGELWQIYRPADALRTPGKSEVLGYEAKFLGTARVQRYGDVATLQIVSGREEIAVGDRLLPNPREAVINYVPRAPEKAMLGQVIALPMGVAETGRSSIVTLDLGSQQGLELGHVLALYRAGREIPPERPWLSFFPNEGGDATPNYQGERPKILHIPDERFGLVFVFRVFERVSYAYVLNSSRPVMAGDQVRKP